MLKCLIRSHSLCSIQALEKPEKQLWAFIKAFYTLIITWDGSTSIWSSELPRVTRSEGKVQSKLPRVTRSEGKVQSHAVSQSSSCAQSKALSLPHPMFCWALPLRVGNCRQLRSFWQVLTSVVRYLSGSIRLQYPAVYVTTHLSALVCEFVVSAYFI